MVNIDEPMRKYFQVHEEVGITCPRFFLRGKAGKKRHITEFSVTSLLEENVLFNCETVCVKLGITDSEEVQA